jgi:hypothetical protein
MFNQIFLVVSLTSITTERAHYLYSFLTETGSLVTTTMMAIWLAYQITALPYGALVTWIAKHAKVSTKGLTELLQSMGPINSQFLNASNAHLREAEPEQRPPQPPMAAKADGVSSSVSQVERLGHLEDMPREA